MVVSTESPESALGIEQLGLRPGMVVQEFGWDEDVDSDLRDNVMDAIDGELIEDADESVDVVLLWQRNDSDVADSMVDAVHDLGPDGYLWLLTPKIGRPGYVDPADIAEGAETAGLSLTVSVEISLDWHARKIVRPKKTHK